MAQHTSLPDLPPAPSSNPHIRPSIAHQSDPTQIFTRNGDHAPSTQFAAGGRFVASRLVSLLRSLLGSSPVVPPSKVSNTTKLIDRQSSHSSASTSGPQMNNSSTSQARDADRQPAVPETGQHHTSGQSPIAETGQHHTSGQSPIADRSVVKAMQEYPMQTFAAINMVLFERHGYQRMQIHGNPRYIWQCTVRTVCMNVCYIAWPDIGSQYQNASSNDPSSVIHGCDSLILLSCGQCVGDASLTCITKVCSASL